jgi:hypothetical protein
VKEESASRHDMPHYYYFKYNNPEPEVPPIS